jgi:hypothetical protein
MQLEALMPKAGRKAYTFYPNGKADEFILVFRIQRLPGFANYCSRKPEVKK